MKIIILTDFSYHYLGENNVELTDIKSLDLDELTEYIVSLGEPKFRAKQLYEWQI